MFKASNKKKIKAAVIGVGNMGRHHARVYQELPNVDLVGVADLDEKIGKALAQKHSTKYFKDYKKLLSETKPDLVSICVPTRWHHLVTLDALGFGSHVLVEKPIAATLKEAEEMIAAAEKAEVKLTVGHIERFNPVILKLKELIDEGKLGSIISIMARRTNIVPNRIRDANVILDIGVHDIDLLNFLLDRRPLTVHAYGGRAVLRKHEDYADILLEYPKDKAGFKVTGHIQTNWVTPVKIRKINVTGTKGYAVANLITQDLIIFDTNYTSEFDDFEDYIGKFKESSGKKIVVTVVEPLKKQLESFTNAVLGDYEPLVKPLEAFDALRIANLATKNIRSRSK